MSALTACHEPTEWLIPGLRLSLDICEKPNGRLEIQVFDSGKLLVRAFAQLPQKAAEKQIHFLITDSAPLDECLFNHVVGLVAQTVMVGFLKYRCGQTLELNSAISFGFRFPASEATLLDLFCLELEAFSGGSPLVGTHSVAAGVERVTLWQGSLGQLEELARFAVIVAMDLGICRDVVDVNARFVNNYLFPETVVVL